jgi:drug/metabolite transporter (DMT)-like permease
MTPAFVILFVGILVCAAAANLIQASRMDPIHLSMFRVGVAALVLLPMWVAEACRLGGRTAWTAARAAAVPGVVLGIHFMTFLVGVRMTTVANATLLVNLAPAIVPWFATAWLGERLRKAELIGTLLGLAGVVTLVGGDLRLGRNTLTGDLMCLGSMAFFAAYLVLGRVRRGIPGIWLYVVPLYAVAAVTCVPFALMRPWQPVDWTREIWAAGGLALGPTVIGHSAIMYAVRHLRSQTVTLANLTQFIFASLLAWFWTGETPSPPFYPAAVMLVTGAVLAVRASGNGEPTAPTSAAAASPRDSSPH